MFTIYCSQHYTIKVAQFIGIKLVEVETNEGKNEQYIKNEGMSCYSCKTHLYSALNSVITHVKDNQTAPRRVVLFNGTNKDDLIDTTRVGLLAAQDFNVSSPLDEFSKLQVRALAKEFGLFNHDYAASPCLRSRLAFGVTGTIVFSYLSL